jgi:single-stranded-DNA-specific exonuclease
MIHKKHILRYSAISNAFEADSVHAVLKRVFAHRGITDINQITYTLNHLQPYQSLLQIDKAVTILADAIASQAHLLVLGDFDADGATSTALAVSALKAFGAANVSYLVPNRFEFGYGLTPEIVDVAAQKKPDLLITVDNGISSCAGVTRAKEYGMRVIVTDHHLPGTEIPQADAIVNPNQHGDLFPSKNLAGVGVIFYCMWALRNLLHARGWFEGNAIPIPNLASFLDLVALGTVADLVPLDHNNRILVQQGLQRIRAGHRPGIQALLEIAGRSTARVVSADLGFAVGPRLNAAGRLEDMSLGIECLLSPNLQKAREIAQKLDCLNQERRLIEGDMQQQADYILKDLFASPQPKMRIGVCLYHAQWHQGVIGILASRVKERLYRPVIAFANSNESGVLKGSARSIPGLHIRDVLDRIADQYPGLISKFGGHAQAAGLQLELRHFEAFSEAFDTIVREQLSPEALTHKIMTDGELCNEEFSLSLAYLLRESTPWGQQFPEPLFDGRFKILDQRLVGSKHLKLSLMTKTYQNPLNAIAFNVDLENWPNEGCEYIQAAYRLDMNDYQGQQSLQLILEYLEPVP